MQKTIFGEKFSEFTRLQKYINSFNISKYSSALDVSLLKNINKKLQTPSSVQVLKKANSYDVPFRAHKKTLGRLKGSLFYFSSVLLSANSCVKISKLFSALGLTGQWTLSY